MTRPGSPFFRSIAAISLRFRVGEALMDLASWPAVVAHDDRAVPGLPSGLATSRSLCSAVPEGLVGPGVGIRFVFDDDGSPFFAGVPTIHLAAPLN